MTYQTVIKHGRVVTATASFQADVAISGEKIVAVGVDLHGEREIDARGMLVTPGAVDIHVHMQMALPNGFTSSDTFFTGTRAAALGGTTAIVDFAECKPDEPLLDGLARRRAEADGQVAIDYGLHMTVSPHELKKADQFQAAYDAGCATFKLYMAYGFYLDDGELLQALQAVRSVGGLPVVHAENWPVITTLIAQNRAKGNTSPAWHPRSRPAVMEGDAVGRVIDMARCVGTPVHIFHVGCADAIERIAEGRAKGYEVTAETCPQYLMLTEEAYQRDGIDGALPVCAPPIRSEHHREQTWAALRSDALQIVTTDHCPFTRADKQRGLNAGDFSQIPGGVPSIEVRLPLLYSYGVQMGTFSENRWVEMACTRPAQLAGFPHKGHIAVGYDADIVVFDPNAAWTVSSDTLHEQCDWTPYDGVEMRGRVHHTFSRGRQIVDAGEFIGEAGHGRYIVRRRS